MVKTILQGVVKRTRRRGRLRKTWLDNIKDLTGWSLANLSEQLKIEYDGDELFRRYLWCHNDHQCKGNKE